MWTYTQFYTTQPLKIRKSAIYSNMDATRDFHTKWSKSKWKLNIWYHLQVESKVWQKWTYLQNRSRLLVIENRCLCLGEGGRERDGLGIWSWWWKLLHLEWINNKVLMISTGNSIECPVINHSGKEYKNVYMCNGQRSLVGCSPWGC